jgi:predicted ATPase
MLVGLFLRHYKIYENAYFIPLTESFEDSFNVFIGNNGVGKSSVLEALDSFFNGKNWNINNNANKNDSYISPIFLIKKSDINPLPSLQELSDYFWNVSIDDRNFNSNKQLTNGYFPLRNKLKLKYDEDDYYLFTIGTIYNKLGDAYFPFFQNHITEKFQPTALTKLKNSIIEHHNYIYIPIESSIKDILAIEANEAQALIGKKITEEIDKILTKKVFSKNTNRKSYSVLDIINSQLDSFMVDINMKMEEIDGRYSYNKEGKVKKNLTPMDVRDIIVKAYFSIRTLKKDKKEINELSSGEQRVALIDMAYAFLSSNKEMSSSTILAIDEPEASMHTSLCFEQFKRLSDLAFLFGHQVITTTHWYGLLPMCQKGMLHHISNAKTVKIKSFSLSNLFEKRREFPDDVEFKSVFDLISSILSIMKNKETNWLICEGSDDAIYFNYFLKDKVKNIIILPVGGCGNVTKIYNYLYGPMSENSEKNMINGKVVCLIDTDDQQSVHSLPSETQSKSLFIRRLQKKDNTIILSKTTQGGMYKKTEIEDCLAPDCFYDSVERVITKHAPTEIKKLFLQFKFNSSTQYSNINDSELRFIEPTTIDAHKNTKDILKFIQSYDIKYKIAQEYVLEDSHDLPWIIELVKLFRE